ncbi:hypothetical protein U1Q18_028121 [Sarracenia purpurea var. burkii]
MPYLSLLSRDRQVITQLGFGNLVTVDFPPQCRGNPDFWLWGRTRKETNLGPTGKMPTQVTKNPQVCPPGSRHERTKGKGERRARGPDTGLGNPTRDQELDALFGSPTIDQELDAEHSYREGEKEKDRGLPSRGRSARASSLKSTTMVVRDLAFGWLAIELAVKPLLDKARAAMANTDSSRDPADGDAAVTKKKSPEDGDASDECL